jgi:thiamine biosynthesis lipoprotein
MGYNRSMGQSSSHSRRDFLIGQSAIRSAGDAVAALIDGDVQESVDFPGSAYLLTVGRRLMACQFEARFNSSREQNDTAAAIAALDLIEQLEDQLTVYRPHSEVMEINRRAATEPIAVEARLFALLELAGDLHGSSGGGYDITSGPLSHVWGFSRREGRLPNEGEIANARAKVGWDKVLLNRERQTVFFSHDGVEINLNSIGKGYALDRAKELLLESGANDFIFHGGRSTLVACGNNSNEERGGWKAGLRHPLRPQLRIAEFTLRDEALSTSGSATQFFRHRGRSYGHLIDPRTGWPAESLHSATVIAPTGAEADALSTAFYVMGTEEVEKFCNSRPHIRALLISPGEKPGTIVLCAYNLKDEDWQVVATV